MTEFLDDHTHYGDTVRTIRLGEALEPTHLLVRTVSAFRIVGRVAPFIGGSIAVLIDGEITLVEVPKDFAARFTPVEGDYLCMTADGDVFLTPCEAFDAQAHPVAVMPGCDVGRVHSSRDWSGPRPGGALEPIPLMAARPLP
jgi:hypothetical protein